MSIGYRKEIEFFKEKLKNSAGLRSFWPTMGHPYEVHTDKTDKDLIEKILKRASDGRKPQPASVFADKNQAEQFIRKAMRTNIANILQWKDSSRYGETFAFRVKFSDTVGKGFMPNLDERITNTVRIVLERDNYTTNGMHIVTAYPDLQAPSANETGRNGKDILQETEIYKDGSVMLKTYSEFMSIPGMSVSYMPATYKDSDAVFVSFIDNNEQFSFRIREDECTYKIRSDRKKSESFGEAYFAHPKRTRKIQKVLHFRDREIHQQFEKEHPIQTEKLDEFLTRRDEIRDQR